MSPRAVRIAPSELTKENAPIISQIVVESLDATPVAELTAALEAALQEEHEGKYSVKENELLVPTRWEPPFKLVRAFAVKHPAAKVTLKADAFRNEYWIARAVYEGGKQTVDDVLTMNDGEAFEILFKEIHGETYAEWKQENAHGQVRGGFAWGAVEDFDPSKSELGKAEGQL